MEKKIDFPKKSKTPSKLPPKSFRQIEREKEEENQRKLGEKRKKAEEIQLKKEINEFLEKYPTVEAQNEAINYEIIENKAKIVYEEKTKKCFHTMGGSGLVESSSKWARSTTFQCGKCNKDYMYEVCSAWNDGDNYYIDKEFEEVKKSIDDLYKKNKRIYNEIYEKKK